MRRLITRMSDDFSRQRTTTPHTEKNLWQEVAAAAIIPRAVSELKETSGSPLSEPSVRCQEPGRRARTNKSTVAQKASARKRPGANSRKEE